MYHQHVQLLIFPTDNNQYLLSSVPTVSQETVSSELCTTHDYMISLTHKPSAVFIHHTKQQHLVALLFSFTFSSSMYSMTDSMPVKMVVICYIHTNFVFVLHTHTHPHVPLHVCMHANTPFVYYYLFLCFFGVVNRQS